MRANQRFRRYVLALNVRKLVGKRCPLLALSWLAPWPTVGINQPAIDTGSSGRAPADEARSGRSGKKSLLTHGPVYKLRRQSLQGCSQRTLICSV